MSSILYYSNYCKNCQSLLQSIAQTSIKDDTHFICIDKFYLESKLKILLIPNTLIFKKQPPKIMENL